MKDRQRERNFEELLSLLTWATDDMGKNGHETKMLLDSYDNIVDMLLQERD